ncbi:MAG: ATP-binding protein [Desulfomonile sp.]
MLEKVVNFVKRFTLSLRFKLSFYTGLVVFLALVAVTYHSISTQEENLVRAKIEAALKDSEVIKAAIWHGMMTKDREVIRQIVRTIARTGGFNEINVYDKRGVLLYAGQDSTISVIGNSATPGETSRLLGDIGSNTSLRHEFVDNGDLLAVVNPLLNAKSCATAPCHAHPESEKVLGALELKLPIKELRVEILNNARKTILFAFSFFIFISTIIGLGVIFLVTKPIKKLASKARKMAHGKYSPDDPETGSDSIAELSRSFDEMSRQINKRTMELEASRGMYKALFEEVPCYLTVVNKSYRITKANRAFTVQFGDQSGKHCFTGYKGLSAKCSNCPVEKTFSDGAYHQSEETWSIGHDRIYVMVKTSPIFAQDGSVTEVMEMAVDVTRLKRLQMELEKKQNEYKYLYENVPCYLTVVDRDFNIVQMNDLFVRDFGANLGKKCFKVYKGADSKCDNCPVEKTFVDGMTHTSEEIWKRNGEETYIIVYTAPIKGEDGMTKAVMEMSTNITEVKRLQGELVILGETIAGMSHTIKNILTGLQGGVYMVDSGLLREREDRVRMGWKMVKNNVNKVSDLVKRILYASKDRVPEYQECDPAELLSEVCDLYESKASAEGILLVRDFQRQICSCLLDPAGIHSVISNLISNAIEACRSGGQSEAKQITVGADTEKGRLLITVSDNGEGIPEDVKNKLFNKFYSTKGAKGTGLGLVITRKIVEEHHGKIKVESEAGRGTSFLIDIPVRSEKEQAEAFKAAL